MLLLFGALFLLFGVILISGGIRTAKTMETEKKETKKQVKKGRHKVQTVYRAVVDYTYDGVEYHDIDCPFGSSSMKEGQSINIKIDPNNPMKPQSEAVLFLLGGIMVLAAVMFLAFFGIILAGEKRQRNSN